MCIRDSRSDADGAQRLDRALAQLAVIIHHQHDPVGQNHVLHSFLRPLQVQNHLELRAHALLAAKKSRRAAAQNLRQKGLAAGEIQQALDAVYTLDVSGEDPELEAAAALVEGHYRKKLEAGRRDLVIAALQRRGFSYSVIKEAIRRVEEGE